MTEQERRKRNDLVATAYRLGASSADIGRHLGLTDRRVLQILEAHGVERRRPKPPPLRLHLGRNGR